MSFFRDQLENYLMGLEIKANRVLDIGGGSNPVKTRVKSWDVKEYKILDNKLEVCKDVPDYNVDMNKPILYNYDMDFDMIFCLEVFEYIFNPIQALDNIYRLLVKGGVAYISFPLLYPIHEPAGHDFLRYTEEGVEKLLKETGFSRWDKVIRYAKPDSQYFLNEFYKIEGMHCRKDNVGSRLHTGYIFKVIK